LFKQAIPLGPVFGFRQSRQKHGGQDRYDGNDYEQFDQGEAGLVECSLKTFVHHFLACYSFAFERPEWFSGRSQPPN